MTSKSRVEKIAKLERRLDNHLPLVGALIRRRAVTALIEDGSSKAVVVLARAMAQNADAQVRAMAHAFVSQVRDGRAINAICGIWYDLRHPVLDTLLLQKQWVAAAPPNVRVFSALKVGALDPLKSARVPLIGPLLMACDDFDPDVKLNLQEVLRHLQRQDAREALCLRLIERDYPMARAIAVETGMAPEAPAMRALFFFLTEQWDRYDALDFDQRLLRVAYEGASATVRQRIRERLRLAGRAEFLAIVVGQDFASRVADMTLDEFEFVVGMLRSHQNWVRLWSLAFEAPLLWSVRILEILASAGWQPPEAEQDLFARLWALFEAGLLLDSEALSQGFPRALLQAHLRAPGHINDVAFAPHRPLLGVGTGGRRVVLWNYQTARREHVLSGFEHSVGQVTFTKDGNLVCAERSNQTTALTGIYGWNGQNLHRMGLHQGPVTALEAVSGSTALSAGRDHDIALWDVATGQQLGRHTLPDWPRAARVAPGGDSVLALLRRRLQWLNLADMSLVARGEITSAPSCATFLPGRNAVFVGRHNGLVSLYSRQNSVQLRKEQNISTSYNSTIQGIEVLPELSYLLIAARQGEVSFFDLANYAQVDQVLLPGDSLTALHVSPDAAFMAIGHTGASFSLWDLRGTSVAALLRAPLVSISPVALGLLDAFADNPKLEESARRTATYAATIVRYRSRFDIELEAEAPTIMAGEFDIEIS